MQESILIIDFGSQYTQLIARRTRELNVYCEIHPYNKIPDISENIKGIILSGSPKSVLEEKAPSIDLQSLYGKFPVLGICYGAQLAAFQNKGTVSPSDTREYGRAVLQNIGEDPLFAEFPAESQVWMSHGDTIDKLPENFEPLASTESIKIAAFKFLPNGNNQPFYGIQFHPEVTHTEEGMRLLENFIINICGCKGQWTPESFIESTIDDLKSRLGKEKVVLGLSGGVDSTVAASLISRAVGKNLYCIFVDGGLLRKNEFREVLTGYESMGFNVTGVDAQDEFLTKLEGVSDPEEKRKIIGSTFIDVFEREAKKIKDVVWLAQGTIYPDVIESASFDGPAATIKSHHNVGGLPEKMNLKIVEPLNLLFKDEVRRLGAKLDIPDNILKRHPFPGPGLAIRILGDITREKIRIVQEADEIFINGLKKSNLYDSVWQALVVLLPVQTVGVMGDERTYEHVICIRAVNSVDGMTADWSKLPYEFLGEISNDIINNVKGVNRVVYDISSKPPSTIEWE
ncbi:MAG: glutamine-hydrolyzing GMP synthase [Bacteroidetes bacterium]|nr:glutamine-hydrolyzing GMP synthase [Bacteroidota bacterium]